ncbi:MULTISPECIES: hypothetical protein [Sphingobacterium]|uniref:hypothetical protein n=1 Tax=Sphingobacterium TaxID=28453 RepID=UPI00062806D4|nr:hypothetical protein [Sphingobacterium sp. Ag1]KKO88725.1 hypothetical protein AAW12_21140 [Sphingobacterium sp. Ag1]
MNWASDNYYFTKLKKDELFELIHFYLRTTADYYNLDDSLNEEYTYHYKNLLGEDLSFFDTSIYYVLRDREMHNIHASIRITYWDRETVLPIQKLFSVTKEELLSQNVNHYWHIGRFIISKRIEEKRISILKKMLFDAFFPPYFLDKGLIIAECDKKLVNTLLKLGIPSYELGSPIIYLYSETLPIYIKTEWLDFFIQKNTIAQYCLANSSDSDSFTLKAKDMGFQNNNGSENMLSN